jgi:hypothetical protein
MIIYISGPISSPDPERVKANKAKFSEAESILRELGHEPVNPVNNGLPDDASWAQHMRADIKMMMDCTHVAVLPGWENSKGARIEVYLAGQLEMPVKDVGEYMGAEL